MSGKVVFVGAGPGAADLITVRGARVIAEADIIIWASIAFAGTSARTQWWASNPRYGVRSPAKFRSYHSAITWWSCRRCAKRSRLYAVSWVTTNLGFRCVRDV